ncbi:hypothetical protein Tco_0157885 [Tanacetum coccineum]
MSWKLHGSSGVHTLVTETELVINMLIEKKYPLRKEVLMQMLKLKLESEEDSTMALELKSVIRKILCRGSQLYLALVVKQLAIHDQTVHSVSEETKLLLKKDRV